MAEPERVKDLKLKRIKAPASLSQIAYESLKESLMKMELSRLPNDGKLDERELAQRLGISRTPLREAIHRLVSEGFLKVVPRKGIFVVRRSKKEIVEILLVRAALEGMAARLATRHIGAADIHRLREIFAQFDPTSVREQSLKYSDANIRFHEMIIHLSQCEKLIAVASNLFDQMRWVRFRAAAFSERHPATLLEHREIIDALEARDADLSEKRMRAHIEGLARYVQEHVEIP